MEGDVFFGLKAPYGFSSSELAHRLSVDSKKLDMALGPYFEKGSVLSIQIGSFVIYTTPGGPLAARPTRAE